MHTNAGVVTALQQAVAHLSSALEMLTNTHINMQIYTHVTWMHGHMHLGLQTCLDTMCNLKQTEDIIYIICDID